VEDWRQEREEVGGWEAEGGFGGDSGFGVLVWECGEMVGLSIGSYLFTFCPPGPEDREKVISHRLRGIVSGFRLASHLRAAERSSSV
jgi:hypothetical protein